jgi:hypothetical protein
MKKFLLITSLMLIFVQASETKAQCSGGANNCDLIGIGNVVVQITSTNPITPTQCEVTFNVAFDLSSNNGNKDIFIHSWLSGDYPSYFPCTPGTHPAPTNLQLGTAANQAGRSFLDIALNNAAAPRGAVGVTVNVPILTTYNDDNTVVLTSPLNSPGMTCNKVFQGGTIDRVTINNAKVTINTSCTSAIEVRTDVWSKNGTNGPAQCWVAGISQFFNDPVISGFRNCLIPRQYRVNINTLDPNVKTVTYKVYIDMNDNNTLEPGGPDVLAFTSGSLQISAPGGALPDGYTSGLISLPAPYSNSQPYADKGYLVLVEGPTLTNSILSALPNPGCNPLPVSLKSFTAKRNGSAVALRWITSSEQNCSGYAIERNIGGSWQRIALLSSKANGGNSNDELSYSYDDLNTVKGITQYRIQQIDLDDKSRYSEIRSVRGDGQPGKVIVYPNPSNDGMVKVSFEESNVTRDVSIADMSGRIVKQWRGYTNNNLTVENLVPGMYSLRVINAETGEQTVQKIVVNKR